ncbi:MAG: diguanylate cyclase [Armatimonadetes bacterium]|nr:diguanylate cyclase [Armatimonadota bacterium]
MRILAAEDDRVALALLRRTLEKLGHEVETVEDGQAALDTLRTRPFDVLISDRIMPRLCGLDLCRALRALDGPYVYYVMLTAMDSREDMVAGMEAGVDEYLAKPLDPIELRARLIAAERIVGLHRSLVEQRQALERLNHELWEHARIDALTHIGNRQRMEEDLAAMHDRVSRYGHSYAVGLCDVDWFKIYNDTCGHQAGDAALAAVARVLDDETRAGDSVYRYGGEEFLVLLAEQSLASAYIAMQRMCRAVDSLGIAHPGLDPAGVVTISCGISGCSLAEPKSVQELLGEADAALYRAKERGRNRVVCHGWEPG